MHLTLTFGAGHLEGAIGRLSVNTSEPTLTRAFHLRIEALSMLLDGEDFETVATCQVRLEGPQLILPGGMQFQVPLREGVVAASINIEIPDQGPGEYRCVVSGLGPEERVLRVLVER